ncbi:MAG: hypothetical protein WD740_07655 [Anaerolineales bacterium]
MSANKLFIWLGNFIFTWGFVQIILIGAAYFGVINSNIHGLGGLLLAIIALVMLILALAGRMGTPIIALTVLVLLMIMPLQGALLHIEGLPSYAKAMHPVFGIGIMFLGRSLAARAEKLA